MMLRFQEVDITDDIRVLQILQDVDFVSYHVECLISTHGLGVLCGSEERGEERRREKDEVEGT
jgi:hypothetical protein